MRCKVPPFLTKRFRRLFIAGDYTGGAASGDRTRKLPRNE